MGRPMPVTFNRVLLDYRAIHVYGHYDTFWWCLKYVNFGYFILIIAVQIASALSCLTIFLQEPLGGHWCMMLHALQWRHNEHDGVPNSQRLDCLLSRLFRRRSKKTSKLRVTGLCEGNSPVTCEFPAQRASNAKNVAIWWRHHGCSRIMTSFVTNVLSRAWRQRTVSPWATTSSINFVFWGCNYII